MTPNADDQVGGECPEGGRTTYEPWTIRQYDISRRAEDGLHKDGTFEIEMPKDARVLSVTEHDRGPVMLMWAAVAPKRKTETRRFLTCFTGQTLARHPSTLRFIGTITIGWIVLHIFEVTS